MKTARPWIALWAVLALLLPLLAACATQPTASPAVSPTASQPEAATSVPATVPPTVAATGVPSVEPTEEPAQGTGVSFEEAACPFDLPAGQVEGETVDCGYLVVPENRAKPDSPSIRLAVAIFHPEGEAAADPIVYLEGGPGGSALELISLGFADQFEPYLQSGRDIIVFDQRGVGLSEPALDCPDVLDLSLELLDWEIDGKEVTPEEAANLTVEADVACGADLAKTADLTAYSTEESAADVADLAQALGYDQVNLWGVSYGTNLALAVMRAHPDLIRSVVLDSVYPPDVDLFVEGPANADRAFDVLFEACETDAACNEAYPDLRTVLTDTVARLNESPAAFPVTDVFTNETYDTVITGDDLMIVLFQLLYYDDVIPAIPQIIYDARDESYDMLGRMLGVIIAQWPVMSPGMQLSVQCRDEVAFSSQEDYEAAIARYPALEGMFASSSEGPVAYVVCEDWGAGRAPETANQPVTSDIPTLLMAGEFDPVTPPNWARQVAATLENGRVFEYPGVGHGASVGDGCPREMMLAFLEDPAAVPDDSCIAAMPEVEFVVPTEGQATVTMEPFTNAQMGIQGVAPAGWEMVSPGVYSRSSSALDSAVLIEQAAPATADQLLSLLVGQLGLAETPTSVGERQANGLTWKLYSMEVQGLAVDMALSEADDLAMIVLLQATPKEHDALYESAFLPAVDALQPIKQ